MAIAWTAEGDMLDSEDEEPLSSELESDDDPELLLEPELLELELELLLDEEPAAAPAAAGGAPAGTGAAAAAPGLCALLRLVACTEALALR